MTIKELSEWMSEQKIENWFLVQLQIILKQFEEETDRMQRVEDEVEVAIITTVNINGNKFFSINFHNAKSSSKKVFLDTTDAAS